MARRRLAPRDGHVLSGMVAGVLSVGLADLLSPLTSQVYLGMGIGLGIVWALWSRSAEPFGPDRPRCSSCGKSIDG